MFKLRNRTVALTIGIVAVTVAFSPVGAGANGEEASDGSSLDRAMRIRTLFGFAADEAVIRSSFLDNASFPNDEWSVPLTEAEAAEVARRVAGQKAVDPVVVWASENLSEFGGMWLDHARGAVAVFQLKEAKPDSVSGIEARVPAGVDYEIVRVTRAWSDLLEIQARVLEKQDDLLAGGIPIVSTAIHTPTNSVLIGLAERSQESEAYLRSQFGDGLTFRSDVDAHADACPWTQCLPAKGGIRMRSLQVANHCTTGFIGKVTSASPNYYVALTAGHCFRAGSDTGEGDDWRHYQGTTMTKFGDAEKQTWYDNSGADVGLIRLSSTPSDRNNFVGYESGGSFTIRSLTSRASNAEHNVGDFVCRMGGHLDSGYDCGVITNVEVSRESPIEGIGSMTILNQSEADFDSLEGDSGGSVYLGFEAYGTHTHSTDPGEPTHPRSWFTPIGRGESAYNTRWGVTFRLCLNDSCSVTD